MSGDFPCGRYLPKIMGPPADSSSYIAVSPAYPIQSSTTTTNQVQQMKYLHPGAAAIFDWNNRVQQHIDLHFGGVAGV
jgi:hypothetical protein